MATPKKYTHTLKYDFFALPSGRELVEEYPELLMYPEIAAHGTGENARWLHYCVLLTDMGSGLLKTTDLQQRHREALRLVGLDAAHPRAEAALMFTDEGVAQMSHALLRDSDNMKLAYVLSGETMLWQDMYKMRQSPEVKQEDDKVPDDETPAQARARENRARYQAAQETGEKIQKTYSLRGEFFDKLPARIDQLNEEREKLFRKDKLLEKAVVADARQNEGIVERMVREKNQTK